MTLLDLTAPPTFKVYDDDGHCPLVIYLDQQLLSKEINRSRGVRLRLGAREGYHAAICPSIPVQPLSHTSM